MISSNQIYNIHSNLYKKYLITKDKYDINIITNILYNEKTKIVCTFKETLIYDDPGEFLKRFYNLNECFYKIKIYCEHYHKNRKNFPNYINLPESKYIFKNIKKKQKILYNEEENEEKSDEDNYSYIQIFSNSVMNSILSKKTNSSKSSEDKSIKKLIKNILSNEENNSKDNSELSNKNNQITFIKKNNNIEYKISKGKTSNRGTRHHYKKFIKDFHIDKPKKKFNKEEIQLNKNSEFNNIKNSNNSNSKTKIIKSINSKKFIPKINIEHIIKSLNVKIPHCILSKEKSKSKSKSKGREILTERKIKTKGKIEIEKDKLSKTNKKQIIKPKNNISTQKTNKKEAKSMPKLSSSINKTTGINKITPYHKQMFSAANKKIQKFTINNTKNINKNIKNKNIKNTNNNINNIHNIKFNNNKSFLKFTNIKLQKPSNNFTIEIQFHNAKLNPNNYMTKHIPSLHISLNTNFKNTSTLSKSKSKSKSNSKSKSKSPNSTSNSINKNLKKHNTINSFNKNFKYFNNNIRALIHKDILFNSGEGLHSERVKPKNHINKIRNNSLAQKINKINLNNSNNIFKRNIHQKIISSTTSSEYTKKIQKTTIENNTNSNKIKPKKNRIIKSNISINKNTKNILEDKKRVYSDSQKTLKTPINNSSILYNINSINIAKKIKIKNSGSNLTRTNNSNIYKRYPVRKIKSNEKSLITKSPFNKKSLLYKSVLLNLKK